MTIEATAARNGQSRLALHAAGAAEPSRAAWLLCRAGTMLGAVPIEHVIEIMRPLPLEQVAGAPPYVRGLSVIRGAPIPVVDIGLIVNGVPTRAARLVTVRAAARVIALAVDEVIGIAVFTAEAFGQLPPLLRDAAAETIAGVGAADAELVVVLCTSRLVPQHIFAHLDAAGAPS
jgi:purine-binding chemotaxis protein CheW